MTQFTPKTINFPCPKMCPLGKFVQSPYQFSDILFTDKRHGEM